jgi:mRNA interferase HigB
MVIITKRNLTQFGLMRPRAVNALNQWFEITKQADWASFADVKKTFNSVD